MKALGVLVFVCLSSAWGQTSLPDLPDSAPLCTFEDGAQFTMGDFRRFYAIMPPENQQLALRDRKAFLDQWGFMRKLALMAEKENLQSQTPAKDAIDYYRMMILSQAELSQKLAATTVDPDQLAAAYEAGKDKYKQVRIKAIYLAFVPESPVEPAIGKKTLSEDQAKARAAKIVSDARAGGDFVKFVRLYSDDQTSREKDGDFATLRPTDNIPDAIRAVVFSMKTGEVSEPIRQQNGFYILRAEDVSYRPLSQVRDEIFTELKNRIYAKWLEDANRSMRIVYHNPAFIGAVPMSGELNK